MTPYLETRVNQLCLITYMCPDSSIDLSLIMPSTIPAIMLSFSYLKKVVNTSYMQIILSRFLRTWLLKGSRYIDHLHLTELSITFQPISEIHIHYSFLKVASDSFISLDNPFTTLKYPSFFFSCMLWFHLKVCLCVPLKAMNSCIKYNRRAVLLPKNK